MEHKHTPEHGHHPEVIDLREHGKERLEAIKSQGEQTTEHASERHEMLEKARQSIESTQEAKAHSFETAPKERPHILTHLDKMANYRITMRNLQSGFSPAARNFSKFIHAPAVEKASEIAAKTIMRPSITLGATITSMLVGGFFYFVAKRYGYALSGSEFVLTLATGALLGLGVEGLYKGWHRLKHR